MNDNLPTGISITAVKLNGATTTLEEASTEMWFRHFKIMSAKPKLYWPKAAVARL